jgi:tripartite-type tricarboxylate transporter receptor subunit TctC
MLRALALVASLIAAAPALAQQYPRNQPIRIVVPFNPGGTTDLLARNLAEFLQKRMNHTFIVENKPGAATMIGTDVVAKAAPDGHTLLLVYADLASLPAVRKDIPYKFDEFTYLARIFTPQNLIVAGPNSGITSIQDLVAKIKANPGKIKAAIFGVGAYQHLASLKFDTTVGGKELFVPYGGQGPSSIDAVSGVVDIIHGASVPLLDGLKVLGPTGSQRHPSYPDLPTLGELGYKEAEWAGWFGVVGPPKLPKEIADRLTAEIVGVVKDPAFRQKVTDLTKLPPEAEPLTGEAFRKTVIDENKRWQEIAAREKVSIP